MGRSGYPDLRILPFRIGILSGNLQIQIGNGRYCYANDPKVKNL